MTYIEHYETVCLDASVAVMVMMGAAPDDVEFVQLKPIEADETVWAEIKARWPGRGLRTVGILALTGTTPRCILKEPLDSQQIAALRCAFLAYLHALFCDGFVAQDLSELAELECLYALQDPRMA